MQEDDETQEIECINILHGRKGNRKREEREVFKDKKVFNKYEYLSPERAEIQRKQMLDRNKSSEHPQKNFNKPHFRQEVWLAYCQWIAGGKSKEGFSFYWEGRFFTGEYVENFAKDYPDEMPREALQAAEAQARDMWESIGYDIMVGKVDKANPTIWQTFMRNRHKWDREEQKQSLFHSDIVRLMDALEVTRSSRERAKLYEDPPKDETALDGWDT